MLVPTPAKGCWAADLIQRLPWNWCPWGQRQPWPWWADSCRGCGVGAASSYEACWAQPLKVFVLFGLQILGSAVPHLARSNVKCYLSLPSSPLWHLGCVWAGKHLIARAASPVLVLLVLSCPQLLFVGSLAHCGPHPVPGHFDNPHTLTFLWVTHVLAVSHFSFLAPSHTHWISIASCAQTLLSRSYVAQGFTALFITFLLSKTGFWTQNQAYGQENHLCFRMT